jgi:acetyl esterase
MTAKYDPGANYEIRIWEEDFRQVPTRMLLARICQPVGDGPFPVLLDLHGGAWVAKDRTANVAMAEAMARSGILTVSIDLRLGGEAPYPASVQDANYGIRWLKMKAPVWNGDPSTIGLLGSSPGGHLAQLLGMRPWDPRYNALPLDGHEKIDAHIHYVAVRSPISDPLARYQNALAKGRQDMADRHHVYFDPFSNIEEANPQLILERKEPIELPPMLIMQGGLDDNVLPAFQKKFSDSYRAAGGRASWRFSRGAAICGCWNPGMKPIARTKCSRHLLPAAFTPCNRLPESIKAGLIPVAQIDVRCSPKQDVTYVDVGVRYGSKADVTVGDDLSPPLMHNRTPSGRKCPCYTIGYSVTFPNLWHR